MGIVLSLLTGTVLWVVLWAIGVKSIDAFFLVLVIALIAVGVRHVAPMITGDPDT